MNNPWQPLGTSPGIEETLYEGVPPWLHQPLKRWALEHVTNRVQGGGTAWNRSLIEEYDRRVRSNAPLALIASELGLAELESLLIGDELLRLTDFLVWKKSEDPWAGAQAKEELGALLQEAGSAWSVGTRDGQAGLERRVPVGVQVAAEETIRSSGQSGRMLAEAWHEAFGHSPNPSLAYSRSIQAVEEACIPVVLPDNDRATLGSVVQTLRAHGDWSLPLAKAHPDNPSWRVVLSMCQALWSGQTDRHGANDYRPPTQSEAEAAVLLAVPLVQWFTSGAVARRQC